MPPARTLMDDPARLLGDVSRRSVRDVIAEKLAALIASGVLTVGDALPGERELAGALSVSRETIRGAIAILAAHGVLRVAHGARTMVAKTDLSGLAFSAATPGFARRYDLDSVHEARLLVEQRVAADAARNISGRVVLQLEKSLRAQEDCHEDPVRFLLCDREFHGLVYRASDNALLADMAMDLYNYLLEHRRRIVARPGSIATSIADHRDILEALRNRDRAAAVAAFARHEHRIYETTRQFLAAQAQAPVTGA